MAGVLAAAAEGEMAVERCGDTSMTSCFGQGPGAVPGAVSLDRFGDQVVPSSSAKCDLCPVFIFNAPAVQDVAAPWARLEQVASGLNTRIHALHARETMAFWRFAHGPPKEA